MTLNEAITLIQTPFITASNSFVCADLGCGSGLFTLALASLLYKGSKVYGVDQRPALKNTVTANAVSIEVIKADFENDNLFTTPLDGVLMANALHYVKDKKRLFRKLNSMLKPGAFILIVEYNTDRPVERWVPYPVSFDTLHTMLIAEGYRNVSKLREHPSVYGNGNIYSSLILT